MAIIYVCDRCKRQSGVNEVHHHTFNVDGLAYIESAWYHTYGEPDSRQLRMSNDTRVRFTLCPSCLIEFSSVLRKWLPLSTFQGFANEFDPDTLNKS
jgi:hypothetical protein